MNRDAPSEDVDADEKVEATEPCWVLIGKGEYLACDS